MEQNGSGSASPFCRASSLCEETETMSSVRELEWKGPQEPGDGTVLRVKQDTSDVLQTPTFREPLSGYLLMSNQT